MRANYRVFISSTYLDNETRRKLVEDAVINADMTPVGMERFTASVRPTVEECVRLCQGTDVLVGVIARRYGWIPKGHDRSITEIEYDAARDRLMFLIDDSAPTNVETDDTGPDRDALTGRLERFKTRITEDQTPTRFTDNTLQLKVYRALEAWRGAREMAASARSEELPSYASANAVRRAYGREIEGLARLHTTFVGRQDVIRDIIDFARRKKAGYLLVMANAGYGKTALLLRSRDALESSPRVRPDIVSFFVRGENRDDSPNDFLAAANSQLLDLLHLGGGVPADFGTRQNQFSQLWRRAAEHATAERPLLFLVDGLDECAPGKPTIADMLPATLGDYVHVACTSKPTPDPRKIVPMDHPLRSASLWRLPELQTQDVEELLRSAGTTEDRLASLAPRVFRLTNGMPLYTRFLCADVAEGGEDMLLPLQQQPPVGVQEYFARQLDQLVARAEDKRVREALGVLLVSRGPMKLEEIADVLKFPLWDLRKGFEPIRRFLIGEDRVRLMHAELARALKTWFSPAQRGQLAEQLTHWCKSFSDRGWPDDTPEYVLKHYAEYLSDAGDYNALDELLDSRWTTLQVRAGGPYDPLLRAAGLGLEAAKAQHPACLHRELQTNLILAHVASISGYAPPQAVGALARSGRFAEAQSHAELILGPYDRASAYEALAEAFAARAQQGDARSALGAALDAIAAMHPHWVVFDILRRVATAMARAGDVAGLERALAIAEQHPIEHIKTGALCGVALGFAALPDGAEEASSIARTILRTYSGHDDTPPYRAERIERALDVAVAAHDDVLMNELRGFVDEWRGFCRADAVSAYAAASAALGRVAEARRYARRALRIARSQGSQELARCAEKLAAAPVLEAHAKEAAEAAIEAAHSESPMFAEATRHVAVESWSKVASASDIERVYKESEAWLQEDDELKEPFAVGFAKTGALDRALSAVGTMDPERRDGALRKIGLELCALHRPDEARRVIDEIPRLWARPELLAAIALEDAKQGRFLSAEETARQAISETQHFGGMHDVTQALVSTAQSLRDVGQLEWARRVGADAIHELTIRAYDAVYEEYVQAVDILVRAEAFKDAYRLAVTVGKLRGGMIGQRPSAVEQARVISIAMQAWKHIRDETKVRDSLNRLVELSKLKGHRAKFASCDEVEIRVSQVRALAAAGQHEPAIDAARVAMTRAFTLGAGNDPRIPLLGNLVDLLTSLKQPSLARETARQMVKALEEHRWAESAWLRRDQSLVAMSLARVGRVAQATKIARKLLSEARANPGVLAESGEDNLPTAVALLGEEALQDLTALWQQALQLARPENRAAALSVLATALHKIGRPDRALECLRQAFDAARADGHSDAFFLFADGTDIIAHHDRGLLLWQTYERLQKFRRMLLAARQAA